MDLVREINPIVRGWVNYYGAFYRSALYPLLGRINAYLEAYSRPGNIISGLGASQ
jgi:hypothetical protein